ncbi:MAG: UDP-N-acetylglucosamine 2-epimerase [Candidatus Magasanikbacteria bacterium GW2011_GWA2_56_11]|uniref:UDP-N-acetylglucosamine 2-epimerase n=1 Tax=Candidatus Magasanikbacteria bacterium GW2011_GWA2_56_11 TaxID=1619044 RepID=A0A0G2BA50_9BACT|nr:MAG: UDP-N-acetylglucosamine 2-epimerase [Candidatus Magasanikbacteria bacterium GW2011_GWA2_56_11]
MLKQPRKICFVITSNIHYGRSKTLLQELRRRPGVELQIIVGASAILPTYGDVLAAMAADGFKPNAKITMTFEGGSPVAMAKTTGVGITEFATAFENLEPDVVVVRADRYEVLSAAVASAYLNIPVAHIEGGDVSGTIDESVRHAITKLAHIHFATNEVSRNRILRMGERPEYVFDVGSPELEYVAEHTYDIAPDFITTIGVGEAIDITKRFIIVMQHPVTSEVGSNREHVEETLDAVHSLRVPAIWFWPNVDAGTDEVSKGIRVFRERHNPENIRFIKYLSADEFVALLKRAACLVGNSSAGIKECSFLGTPVVNIGTRQQGRIRAGNVVDAGYDAAAIRQAVQQQLAHGPYASSTIYYKPGACRRIADILESIDLYTQKRFFDGDQPAQ